MTKLSTMLVVASSISLGTAREYVLDKHSDVRQSVNDPPLELDVDATSTYNDKFMALMESPCRPEDDGFFGATTGIPVIITYHFRLEAEPLVSAVKLLDIVEDKLIDSILSHEFPATCGFRRRRLDGNSASGFRFFSFQEVGKCDAKANTMNFCGIFSGQLNVYGRYKGESSTHVAEVIEDTLNPSDTTKFHPQLIAMTLDHEELMRDGGMIPVELAINQSMMAWIGMMVMGLIFLFAVWWFLIRSHSTEIEAGVFSQKVRNRRIWNRFYSKSQLKYSAYDADDASIMSTQGTKTVVSLDGERLSIAHSLHSQYRDDDFSVDSFNDETEVDAKTTT